MVQYVSVNAQDEIKMSFSVQNVPLATALYRFSNQSGINLTYNAGDEVYRQIVTYEAVDKAPFVILGELLGLSGQKYKMIGNQVVLYPGVDKDSEAESLQSDINDKISETSEPKLVVPNVIKNPKVSKDTIFVFDTIFVAKIDTLLKIDTVFMEIPAIDSSLVNIDSTVDVRDKSWAVDFFVSPIFSSFSLVSGESSKKLSNYSIGFGVSKQINRCNINIAFGYLHFADNYTYNYKISDGGFYISDTIDEYYTVSGIDTSWFYLTDSTWKPLETKEYSYELDNKIGYLQFLGSFTYDIIKRKNSRYYIKGGLSCNVIVTKKGRAFNSDNPNGIDFSNLGFESPVFSFLGAFGTKVQLAEKTDFVGELYYFSSFGNTVKDYPSETKMNGIGLQLGIRYYF